MGSIFIGFLKLSVLILGGIYNGNGNNITQRLLLPFSHVHFAAFGLSTSRSHGPNACFPSFQSDWNRPCAEHAKKNKRCKHWYVKIRTDCVRLGLVSEFPHTPQGLDRHLVHFDYTLMRHSTRALVDVSRCLTRALRFFSTWVGAIVAHESLGIPCPCHLVDLDVLGKRDFFFFFEKTKVAPCRPYRWASETAHRWRWHVLKNVGSWAQFRFLFGLVEDRRAHSVCCLCLWRANLS